MVEGGFPIEQGLRGGLREGHRQERLAQKKLGAVPKRQQGSNALFISLFI